MHTHIYIYIHDYIYTYIYTHRCIHTLIHISGRQTTGAPIERRLEVPVGEVHRWWTVDPRWGRWCFPWKPPFFLLEHVGKCWEFPHFIGTCWNLPHAMFVGNHGFLLFNVKIAAKPWISFGNDVEIPWTFPTIHWKTHELSKWPFSIAMFVITKQ